MELRSLVCTLAEEPMVKRVLWRETVAQRMAEVRMALEEMAGTLEVSSLLCAWINILSYASRS
jgi:hypothetical protein